MSSYRNDDELMHFGIKGQKWGVRRYQNKDGSLTPAGRRRMNKLKEEYTSLTGKRLVKNPAVKTNSSSSKTTQTEKALQDMTLEEIRTKTDRLLAENNYINAVNTNKSLNPKQVSKGKKFIDKLRDEVIVPAATDVAKQLAKSYMVDAANKAFKLEGDLKVHTNNKKKN